MHDLSSCRVGITPTLWQRSQFPIEYQPKIIQAHDGINTNYFEPAADGLIPPEKLDLPDTDLTGAKELVTYCSRGLEPYRGFPQFYESLPEILEERPDCHVLIVGEDRVCYSARLPEGESYKKQMMEKVKVDEKRVHFTGPCLTASTSRCFRHHQPMSILHGLSCSHGLSWKQCPAAAS